MSWTTAAEEIVTCPVSGFYSGVDVWLKRPQVLNRRLLGCVEVYTSPDTSPATILELEAKCNGHGALYREVLLSGIVCEGGGNSCVVVRRLLPRMRNMAESLEGVVIGKLIKFGEGLELYPFSASDAEKANIRKTNSDSFMLNSEAKTLCSIPFIYFSSFFFSPVPYLLW